MDRIGKVGPVYKPLMDMHKEREKQNQEKRQKIIEQKAFLEMLRRKKEQEKIESSLEGHHFDRRV